MALVDEVTIHVAAGKGGDGVVRWLHLKGKEKGGPAGGDGGRGGDVVIEGVRDLTALARYRHEKRFAAENGGAGESELRHGKNGEDLVLRVPAGTEIRVVETGAAYEILEEGERVTVFRGGGGGKGNARFKSSTNQNPWQHTAGGAGTAGDIVLSLKLIAEVGIVGLPSAGKSSLLNALTRAKARTAAYPFTTLEPNLGDFYGHILADIPGLIEGASEGKGLGTAFLKHIERTKILIHLVSADQEDPLKAYMQVRRELEAFGHGLAEKPEIIALSKVDLCPPGEGEAVAAALSAKTGCPVHLVSVENHYLLKRFADELARILAEAPRPTL